MLIYILYFIFIAVLAIQYQFTPFKTKYPLLFIILSLAFLAGFQDVTVSRDYGNYQFVFDNIEDITGYGPFFLVTFEPAFAGIVLFFKNVFSSNYGLAIMMFFGLAGLSMKVFAIDRLSINPYLTLLFYFSYFFLVQEMTQIRIALASGIFLISLFSFFQGKKGTFIALIVLATCFHYSAICFLLILFFNTDKLNRNLYIGILIVSLLLGVVKLPILNLIGNFDVSNISSKLYNYVELSRDGIVTINTFNSLNILNILCCFYLLLVVNNEDFLSDKRLVFFMKCDILSIFLFTLLAGAPSIAMRFNELFSVAQIFLFTYLVRYLPAKRLNIFMLVLIAGFFFYVNEFYGELLAPFKIITIH